MSSANNNIGKELLEERLKYAKERNLRIVTSLRKKYANYYGLPNDNHCKLERTFFEPDSNIMLEDFFVLDANTLSLVDPFENIREHLANENNKDQLFPLLIGETEFYKRCADECDVTVQDAEFGRKQKERVLVVVEISRYWLEWFDSDSDFNIGVSTLMQVEGEEEYQRHYYLYNLPSAPYKDIYDVLWSNANASIEILRNLESLWDGEMTVEDFDISVEDFNRDDINLTKFLIEQAIDSNDQYEYDIICPERLPEYDEETYTGLCFLKDLILETGYKVDYLCRRQRGETIEIGQSEKRRGTFKKRKTFTTTFKTPLSELFFGEKLPQMIGRKTPDSSDTSTDMETEPSVSKVSEVIDFNYNPLYVSFDTKKKFLRSVSIKVDNNYFEIHAGVYVQLHSGTVLRVLYVFRNDRDEFWFHGAVFIKLECTLVVTSDNSNELVFTGECSDQLMTEVESVVQLKYIPPPKYKEWFNTSSEQLVEEYKKRCSENHGYFVKYYYDKKRPAYLFSPQTKKVISAVDVKTGILPCNSCLKRESLNTCEIVENDDGYVLQIGNEQFNKRECIVLHADTVKLKSRRSASDRFRIDMHDLHNNLEKYNDSSVYTEFDRWKGEYMEEGEKNIERLFESPHLFQVARIKSIIADEDEPYIIVKMFYRPEDTNFTDDEIMKSHPKELFLSNEEYCLPAEKLHNIVTHCYVGAFDLKDKENEFKDNQGQDQWLENGPKRFFCQRKLDPDAYVPGDKLTHSDWPLFKCSFESAPDYVSSSPLLDTLDLFSGVGGLSEGLRQSTIVDCRWAVERDTSHALSYLENARSQGKSTQVFCEDVNEFLDNLRNGVDQKEGQKYPKKGQVEFICGGPPCQGFSSLNCFKKGHAAEKERSGVETFMAAIDYYRPRFALMENVKDLQLKVNGINVLSLLVDMFRIIGYQVTVQLFQAAQYGVPQSRKRVFLLAAAPGEILPDWPMPTNGCLKWCNIKLGLNISGLTFSSPNYSNIPKSGAFYRPMRVWDAISDLEKLGFWTDDEQPMMPCLSYYQKQLRNGATRLTCHITKERTQFVQEYRLRKIPNIIPRADWRFLPNENTYMWDTSEVPKLRYIGRAKVFGRYKQNRAVCQHQIRGDKTCKERWRNTQADSSMPAAQVHTAESNQQWDGVYGRLHDWDVFKTIVTNQSLDGKHVRSVHNKQDRTVTLRELARAQAFPDTYRLGHQRRDGKLYNFRTGAVQLGNAVPPPLAKAIGHKIAESLAQVEVIEL